MAKVEVYASYRCMDKSMCISKQLREAYGAGDGGMGTRRGEGIGERDLGIK